MTSLLHSLHSLHSLLKHARALDKPPDYPHVTVRLPELSRLALGRAQALIVSHGAACGGQ